MTDIVILIFVHDVIRVYCEVRTDFFSAPSMASKFDGSSPLWGLSVANH